jgi:hypothetical protein
MAERERPKFNGDLKHDGLLFVMQTLTAADRHELAHDVLDVFYSKATTLAEFDVLGEMAIQAKYFDLQLRCAETVYTMVTTSEQLFKARENLYKAYNTNNYPEKALFYIGLNDRLRPNDFETLSNRAFNLSLSGLPEAAEALLESLEPNDAKQAEGLDYAFAGRRLRTGETAAGIRSFVDTFKDRNPLFEDRLKLNLWNGAPQPGRTIVVNGEGGIGDEIINIRFFRHLERFGMRPILYSSWYEHRPDLAELFRRHGYEVVTNNLFFKKDWLWTHMMPLPGYLNLREQDLWSGPYLNPLRDPKNRLKSKKFKIGIKCNGNPYFEQDVYRSIPIEKILEYIKPLGAEIYYFDKIKTHPDTINMRDRLNSWEDTLDYLDQMDVVLSSCTSLVHAAGAIGARTLVMTPIAEYYTWTSTRTDETTPWYGDNFRVLKQKTVRSWDEPLARAAELIAGYMKKP